MTYAEALAFWYGRIDYERRQPRPGDLKLDRMRTLLSRLGDPHKHLRCVHVAGTKGKAPPARCLHPCCERPVFTPACFTSPIFPMSRSGIQVDGREISHDEIAAYVSEIAAVVRGMDAANDPHNRHVFRNHHRSRFLQFRRKNVDLAVLEVGLGGRFDSTNVCEPLVSIITNVSFDHTAILGRHLQKIAFQKRALSSQAYQS